MGVQASRLSKGRRMSSLKDPRMLMTSTFTCMTKKRVEQIRIRCSSEEVRIETREGAMSVMLQL